MSINVSTSIAQAVLFLTRPLTFTYDPTTLSALKSILRSTLHASFNSSPNAELVLTVTLSTPPRPLFAACIALGISWAEWVNLLGNREFDLYIDALTVSVRYRPLADSAIEPCTIDIWTKTKTELAPKRSSLLPRLSAIQVRISRIGHVHSSATASKNEEAPKPISVPRIFALASPALSEQFLDENADELSMMIMESVMADPKADDLPHSIPAAYSPISSPESSRPSSRSSTFSTFSFSDCDSEEDMSSKSSCSSSLSSFPIHVKPSPVPRADHRSGTSRLVIDTSKRNSTKYVYAGGVSQTVGGGVMLGRPSASAAPLSTQLHTRPQVVPAPRQKLTMATRSSPKFSTPNLSSKLSSSNTTTSAAPKYRAPIGGRRTADASSAESWRRPTGLMRSS